MRKHGKCIITAVLLLLAEITWADDGAVTDNRSPDSTRINRQLHLQELLVVSHKAEVHSDAYRLITQVSHDRIQALPVRTIADILLYLPGVDVRTRGANGGQADISMRGGTFDQVQVLINGISMNDSHTGHYTLNLPVSPELIERIEVLQGTSVSLSGAFSGAINIITKSNVASQTSNDVVLKLTAGMNGQVNPEIATSFHTGETQINVSAGYSRSEGYYAPRPTEKEVVALRNSDVQLANLYAQVSWRGLDVQAGAQWKDAGLGMGYGFGSQDQFDATRTAFASARYAHCWNVWRLEAQAAYRANYDRYEWHRGQISNRHWNHTATTSLSAHYISRIGTTSLGIGLRNDNIHSTNLGNNNRLHINYFAGQTCYYAGLAASIGIGGTYNAQFGHHLTGNANIGYSFFKTHHIYINAGRSLRMPTFTDLYYDAGNQLGNRDLQPEKAWIISFGYKGEWNNLYAGVDAYYRWGRNIIDWIYTPKDTKRPFHARNQQQVDATGCEISLGYRGTGKIGKWLKHVGIDYAYTYLDLDIKESGSRYLDYLSHKLSFHLEHGIYHGLGASWTVRFQKREGQYNDAEGNVRDYSPVWLLDGSIYWQNKHVRVSADCTNMTNTRFYDYGGILQPGAWATVSIKAFIQ